MQKCNTCGAQLTPPVRNPHTVYVKKLFLVGGRHYCRHHLIAAAGLIIEVLSG